MASHPPKTTPESQRRFRRLVSNTLLLGTTFLAMACAAGTGGDTVARTVELPSSSGSSVSTSISAGSNSLPVVPTSSMKPKDDGSGAPPGSSEAGPPPSASLASGPLPSGPMLFVALGDSLTEGTGDDSGAGGYVALLGAAIDRGGRTGSEVVNLGKSGWDSAQLIEGTPDEPSQLRVAEARIRETVTSGRPALATVLVGSNDLWYLYEYGSSDGTTQSEEVDNLATYRTNLDTIVRRLDEAGARVVIAINDDQSKRPVAKDDVLREATIPATTAAEVQQMSAQARRYAEVVRGVAQTHGAVVVDFLDAPLFRSSSTLADDGNHPNQAGYAQMAETWLAAIRPIVG